jgi:hypothetical protein
VSIVVKQLREGDHYPYQILALGERSAEGSLLCPVFAFLAQAKACEPFDLIKLSALLDTAARRGQLRNEQKFKHLTGSDQIFEFKTTRGLRLFCFFDEGAVILCTHGIIKKGRKTPPGEIAHAENWKRRYFEAKAAGQLTYEPEYPT